MLEVDKKYLRRAFDLANFGDAKTSPNPKVGAVIVLDDKIIGEGYHIKYGTAHAEVNAVNSVPEHQLKLLKDSTIYVSLEPCCIHGKTPPCSDLIIKHQFKRVVVSNLDQTEGVAGKSIKIIRAAGIQVDTGLLEEEGAAISKIRNCYVTQKRPYIVLKWARTTDGFIGEKGEQIWISNAISKRLTHKWRSAIPAILVGTQTALTDQPQLNNRHYYGPSPLRVLIDRQLKVSPSAPIYNESSPSLIFTEAEPTENHKKLSNVTFVQCIFGDNLVEKILKVLYERKINTLLVEGGSKTLQNFIDAGMWDEIRVFESSKIIRAGILQPVFSYHKKKKYQLMDNQLFVYTK